MKIKHYGLARLSAFLHVFSLQPANRSEPILEGWFPMTGGLEVLVPFQNTLSCLVTSVPQHTRIRFLLHLRIFPKQVIFGSSPIKIYGPREPHVAVVIAVYCCISQMESCSRIRSYSSPSHVPWKLSKSKLCRASTSRHSHDEMHELYFMGIVL